MYPGVEPPEYDRRIREVVSKSPQDSIGMTLMVYLLYWSDTPGSHRVLGAAVLSNKSCTRYFLKLQGRFLTLIRFFDSDQKQIENIYRYQI